MRQSKRIEHQLRQQTATALHDSLWGPQRFVQARSAIFHNWTRETAALIEQRVTDRDVALTPAEASLMTDIDGWLDAAEHVLVASRSAGLTADQTEAAWARADTISERDEYAALRQYIHCGPWHNTSARFLNARLSLRWPIQLTQDGFLAAHDGPILDLLTGEMADMVTHEGVGAVAGRFYAVNAAGHEQSVESAVGDGAVALEAGDPLQQRMLTASAQRAPRALVAVELFVVGDPAVFAAVDERAGCSPRAAQPPMHVRRLVALAAPEGLDAWIYEGAHPAQHRRYHVPTTQDLPREPEAPQDDT